MLCAKGTAALAEVEAGAVINVLGPLGHGFDLQAQRPLLVGGGMGLSPLLYYASFMKGKADILMGGRCQQELFWEELYAPMAENVFCTTDDGSYGTKGFVTNALPSSYSYFYTCGPEPMLKAVYNATTTEGEFSFERRMGCGFGACMGCSCKTITGYKRICKEGPVLRKEEILWEK